jgi:tetratricopeptide (TPR) repeat protein
MSRLTLDQAAVELYRSLLGIQPNHPLGLHGMGLHAMQNSQWDMAIQWFDRAVAAEPKSPLYHADLGEALRRAGMTDPAIVALKRALALQPDLTPALESLRAAENEKRLWDAAEAAIQSRRLDVVTLYATPDEEAFRRWHEAVIKHINPSRVYVVNRGLPPLGGERFNWINIDADASSSGPLMSDASSALLLGCTLAYHDRAELLYAPMDCPPTEGCLDKLYHESQQTGIAFAGASTSPMLLIRMDAQIPFTIHFITRWPTDGRDVTQEEIAEICRTARIALPPTRKDHATSDQAQDLYRQILRTDPNNVAALGGMSVYAAHTFRPDMPVRWLSHAVQAAPDKADLHADLGEAHYRSGALPRAIASFQRALQLDPRGPGVAEKLQSVIDEQRRLDSGPSPGGRASRYVIVTGYFSDGSRAAEDFFRIWYDNTLKYAKPHRIYVINAASKPVDYGDCVWINLSENLGHALGGMSRRQQLGGWSMALFVGAMLAYLERADFIYKEQDCLAFGDYVERLYTEIGPAGFIAGHINESGQAAGLLGTALMLGKLNFLPEFIARYLSLRASDVDFLQENKMSEIGKSGRLVYSSMGYDRSRPVNLSDPSFYFQKITADELAALRRAGLI